MLSPFSAKSNMHTLFKMDARTGEMTVAKLINREDPVILAQYGVIDLTVQVSCLYYSQADQHHDG